MTTVDQYFQTLSVMSQEEKDQHLRKDYYVVDQAWPDYLDFLEEWEDNYFSKLAKTRKDFLFHCYAKRNHLMPCLFCSKAAHLFTTDPNLVAPPHDVVCIQNLDAEIDYDACWYKTLSHYDKDLVSEDTNSRAPRLSNSETQVLRRLTALRMTLDSQPPIKLNFNDFMKVWWNKPGSTAAWEIFNNEFTPIRDITREEKEKAPMPQATWLTMKPTKRTECVMKSEIISQHHGLHALLRVREDRLIILQVINSIRIDDPITIDQLVDAISHCLDCRISPTYVATPSPVGVYYSPPGNGKSTALRDEYFIGVDTDWLTKEDFFNRECAPFLRMNLPIVTNQYELAINSGIKFIGSFNDKNLRTDPYGSQFTTRSEIELAIDKIGNDLCTLVYSRDGYYFSDSLVQLFRMNYIYERTRQAFFDKPPPSVKTPENEKKALSVTDLVSILTKSLTSGSGTKHRRRTKAMKRM